MKATGAEVTPSAASAMAASMIPTASAALRRFGTEISRSAKGTQPCSDAKAPSASGWPCMSRTSPALMRVLRIRARVSRVCWPRRDIAISVMW